ncbi:MAG TPA: hypothetical protein VFJ85_18650 [Acidimicrobiales bacterium]|nr:hypothetical protein [Acidimicrobiales bacterium]
MPPAAPQPRTPRRPRPRTAAAVLLAALAGGLVARTPHHAGDRRAHVLGEVITRTTEPAPALVTLAAAHTEPSTTTTVAASPARVVSTTPGRPRSVAAAAGPGSLTVSFAPVAGATSYTVRVAGGSVPSTAAAGTATGPGSLLTVTGLAAGSAYTATVTAANDQGSGPASAPTAAVVPTGPVTNTAALAGGRTFVNQSTSFVSGPGTNASRRPQATERTTTSLFSPPVTGLPAGVEWRLLWLRAHNCEDAPRRLEFFVVDEAAPATVRKFTQTDTWVTGQPNRDVSVEVAAGGQLSWTAPAGADVVVGPGQSVGARWYGMAGGAEACNWQFAAVQQPAGTGADALAAGPVHALADLVAPKPTTGMKAVWATVPAGAVWLPTDVAGRNCETGPRQMEAVLLGPGAITMGSLTAGAGPVTVGPGETFRWSAPGAPPVLPAGWSVGVRWLGLTGDRLAEPCSWEASVADGS